MKTRSLKKQPIREISHGPISRRKVDKVLSRESRERPAPGKVQIHQVVAAEVGSQTVPSEPEPDSDNDRAAQDECGSP
jgi:hypothetical protein